MTDAVHTGIGMDKRGYGTNGMASYPRFDFLDAMELECTPTSDCHSVRPLTALEHKATGIELAVQVRHTNQVLANGVGEQIRAGLVKLGREQDCCFGHKLRIRDEVRYFLDSSAASVRVENNHQIHIRAVQKGPFLFQKRWT